MRVRGVPTFRNFGFNWIRHFSVNRRLLTSTRVAERLEQVLVGFFPARTAFPQSQRGRHPLHSSLTRVAACQIAHRPKGRLCHKAPIRPVAQPNRLSATTSYRQLHGWVLPPLVICAVGAHSDFPAKLFIFLVILVRDREVGGSNPLAPTILFQTTDALSVFDKSRCRPSLPQASSGD